MKRALISGYAHSISANQIQYIHADIYLSSRI